MREYESKYPSLPRMDKMMKKTRLIIASMLVFFVLAFTSCGANWNLNRDKPIEVDIAYAVGLGASSLILSNNPSYIPKVKTSLSLALSAARDKNVDIAELIQSILDWTEEFVEHPEFVKYKPHADKILETFKELVVLDFDIPANYKRAVMITTAFLEGAMKGVPDAG